MNDDYEVTETDRQIWLAGWLTGRADVDMRCLLARYATRVPWSTTRHGGGGVDPHSRN